MYIKYIYIKYVSINEFITCTSRNSVAILGNVIRNIEKCAT